MTAEVRPLHSRRWIIGALSFVMFFPNPGFAVGTNSGLQLGQVLSTIAIPLLFAWGIPRRHLVVIALILTPLLVSTLAWVDFVTGTSRELLLKAGLVYAVAIVPIVVGGVAARRGLHKPLIVGACLAVLVHAVVGLAQTIAFSRGEFPLLDWYQNPSHLQPTAAYALWIRRPMGLFSEPSAMAASIGPWIVLFAGLVVMGPRRLQQGWKGRWQLALAATAGLALVLISGTGYAPILVVVLAMLVATEARGGRVRWSPTKILGAGVAVVLVTGMSIVLTSSALMPRLEDVRALSWTVRLLSMRSGLTSLLQGPLEMAVGVGPGLSVVRMSSESMEFAQSIDVAAVWSVTVRYICETGALGIMALLSVSTIALLSVRRSSARGLGYLCFFIWVVGMWLATSYIDLEAQWVFLGVLLSWEYVFPARQRRDDRAVILAQIA
jgi:hypothetical protein